MYAFVIKLPFSFLKQIDVKEASGMIKFLLEAV